MKKKSIYLLIVLMFSMIINIDSVKANSDYRCYYMSEDKNDKAYIEIKMTKQTSVKYNNYTYNVYYEKKSGNILNSIVKTDSILNLTTNKNTKNNSISFPKYINNNSEHKSAYENKKCPVYLYTEYISNSTNWAYITDDVNLAQKLKNATVKGQSSLMTSTTQNNYLSSEETKQDDNNNDENITIGNETWDKVCRYNSGQYSINLYYKNGLTMLTDTRFGSTYKIYNNEPSLVSLAAKKTKFVAQNKILVNDGKCPNTIYAYIDDKVTGWANLIPIYGQILTIASGWDKRIITYSTNSMKSIIDGPVTTGNSEEIYIREYGNNDMPDITNPGVEEGCEGIINSSLKGLINKYLGYVHIIVPILVLALGVFDFFKAMIASKEDDMKKAQKRFIIRVVAGVLVFLAPTIVNFIIDTLNVGACLID